MRRCLQSLKAFRGLSVEGMASRLGRYYSCCFVLDLLSVLSYIDVSCCQRSGYMVVRLGEAPA